MVYRVEAAMMVPTGRAPRVKKYGHIRIGSV